MVNNNTRRSKGIRSSNSFIDVSIGDLLGIPSKLRMGFHISFIGCCMVELREQEGPLSFVIRLITLNSNCMARLR